MKTVEIRIIKKATDKHKTSVAIKPNFIKLNGEEVNPGMVEDDYGYFSIEFDEKMKPGDVLYLEYDSNFEKVITKNPYAKNSLYKIFGSKPRLKFNHTYDMIVDIDGQEINSSIQVKYNPFYSTVKRIRQDTGTLLDNVSDEIIASIIYDNSKLVVDKLGGMEEVGNNSAFEKGAPSYVKNYVRYKTDIDLCYSIYLSKSGNAGAYTKKLGDLDVSNEIKIPYLSDMLSRFKELLRPNEEKLEGDDSNNVQAFVKAKKTEYPITNRRLF